MLTVALKPLKIVCTAGNGGAGRVVDALEPHLPLSLSRCTTSRMVIFPMASRIRCWSKTVRDSRACARSRPIWGLLGMATLIAASFLISRALLSRAITSWVCWRRRFYRDWGLSGSCMTPGSPGIRRLLARAGGGEPCSVKRAMLSSRSACAKWMRSMGAKCLRITISAILPTVTAA